MTETELELRRDLAACTRMLVPEGILDFSGHVSARLADPERILIQPRLVSRSALAPEDLLVVDLDGNVVEGRGETPSETAIHTSVYRARPDARAVGHGHPVHSVSFTMVDQPMLPMRNFGHKIMNGVPVHPDPTHIRTATQGNAVVETLGKNSMCLLRGHGTVVLSGSVRELFADCLDLEQNAKTQILAATIGKPVPITEEEAVQLRKSFGSPAGRASKVWEHYIHKRRQSDAEGPASRAE